MMYIGIDGGGTKTKMVSYDENGYIYKEIDLPTVHISSQTKQQCIEILKAGIQQLDPSAVSKVGIGLAGYGNNVELRKQIENICLEAFESRTYILESDARIAMEGALDGEDGIIIIAGTGSIALALKDNIVTRCGGWGSQLGDEGSGYWIAKKMLNIFCQEVDGRLEKTKLYESIKKECHLQDDYDIISFINKLDHNRTKIASLAYINGMAAKKGDVHALEIYKESAYEMSKVIKRLAKDFDLPVKVSYIGGVFQNARQYILPYLQSYLGNQYEIISPIHTPEYGAYKLIKKLK